MSSVFFICDKCEGEFSVTDNENTTYESRNYSLCKKCFEWQKSEDKYFKEQEDRYYDEQQEKIPEDE